MKSLYRAISSLLALVAMLLLASCSGAPGCNPVTFGATPCSGSGSTGFSGGGGTGGGGGGGGGGNNTPSVFAYAIDSANSTIDGFSFSDSGATFTPISNYTAPTIASNGGGVGMVVAQQQYLYAAIASVNLIYEYTISTTGTLTPITGQNTFSATYLSDFVSGVGQANMIVNPLGTLMFVSDELGAVIHVYQIGTGGVLTEVTGSPFACPGGFTPMNLATDGLGLYLYAISGNFTTHQGTAIAAFSIGTGTNLGVLTPLAGSPFVGAPYNMWQLRGEPTGQYLIGTTGSTLLDGIPDNPNLYVFSIAQTTSPNPGSITLVDTQLTQFSPFSIAVQSNLNGTLIYSFSFNDLGTALNPIEGYAITATGTLTPDANTPFDLPSGEGTWGQFDESGAYLFTYVSGQNSSGTAVTQLAPLAVASDGTLTQPATPITLNAPGFWVATDPR
jgi:hypothetical protein